jgi:hypothetical protein
MKSIKRLLLLSTACCALASGAHALEPACLWVANGCAYMVVDRDGDGYGSGFINCGEGWVYYGGGAMGSCPG